MRRAFKILLAKAKLPRHIRIHDLRHTAATHMLQAGIDVATVQYITGHRDPQTLIGIYGHAHLDRTRAAAVRRELYLDGS